MYPKGPMTEDLRRKAWGKVKAARDWLERGFDKDEALRILEDALTLIEGVDVPETDLED